MDNKYQGLIIGAISTLISLLLTMTIVIPVFSILPGAFIESIAAMLVDNEPYSNVGKMTIVILSVIFVLSTILTLIYIRKKVGKGMKLTGLNIINVMLIFYFIIHPLVFYIYWGIVWNYRSDGQLIFGAIETFPISSFGFVVIGALIDIAKNWRIRTSEIEY